MPRKHVSIHTRRRNTVITIAGIVAVAGLLAVGYVTGFIGRLLPFNEEGYLRQPPPGAFTALEWSVLKQGVWPDDDLPVVPPLVKPLVGKLATVRGFLLPLHPGKAPEFFVAPKPRGCYFCYPPGISEVVKVNMSHDRKVDITDRPVEVYGKLRLAKDSTYREECLYYMDDAELVVR